MAMQRPQIATLLPSALQEATLVETSDTRAGVQGVQARTGMEVGGWRMRT
jgi:hypothetical protein